MDPVFQFICWHHVETTPRKTRELFVYMAMMVQEAARWCGSGGWREYDAMLWQLEVTSSIYAVSFFAQSSRGRMWHHRLEPNHAAEACALAPMAPRRMELLATRPPPLATTTFPPSLPQSQGPSGRNQKLDQICFSWNEGKCNFWYPHACLCCQGDYHGWQGRITPAPVVVGRRCSQTRG